MRDEKISVVIPAYNAEKYLAECIESVINQTYENIEIIVINDGSKDETGAICEEFKKNEARLLYIQQENGGVSSCRNKGIETATGKLIMFVDADDVLDKQAIERLYDLLDDEDIICCCCKAFDENSSVEDHFFDGDKCFQDDKSPLFRQLLDSQYSQPQHAYTAIGVPWGKLYKRDLLINNNLRFDTDLARAQDNIFNTYAFFYAGKIKYIDELLYNYRLNHIRSYSNSGCRMLVENYNKVIDARERAFVELGLLDDQMTVEYEKSIAVLLVRMFRNGIFSSRNKDTYMMKVEKAEEILNGRIIKNRLSSGMRLGDPKKDFYYSLIMKRKYRLLHFLGHIGSR